MQKEKWKRLKQNKQYLISSWGRTFSLKSKRLLRAYVHNSRNNYYLRINIDGKKYMVHYLVAYHFQYNNLIKICEEKKLPPEAIQVNHRDRNTLNCNNNNLEWTTEYENKVHMHDTSIIKFNGKFYKLFKEKRND